MLDLETPPEPAIANTVQVNCNTISLTSALDDVSLGLGFDNIVCSANHSCEPNLIVFFNQPQLLLRALKPIRKGDELFIAIDGERVPFEPFQAEVMPSLGMVLSKRGPVYEFDGPPAM